MSENVMEDGCSVAISKTLWYNLIHRHSRIGRLTMFMKWHLNSSQHDVMELSYDFANEKSGRHLLRLLLLALPYDDISIRPKVLQLMEHISLRWKGSGSSRVRRYSLVAVVERASLSGLGIWEMTRSSSFDPSFPRNRNIRFKIILKKMKV